MSDSSGRLRRPRPRVSGAEREPSHAKHSVSVDRGFAILERFSGEQGSESIADISDSVGLPRSSVHRYLQTLAALGLVEQRGTPQRRYRLTASAADPGLAAIAATGLQAAAHEQLRCLRRSTSCTARLAVRIGLDALLVDQAPSFAPGQGLPALCTRPGARLPGQRSALGQALLAKLDLDALPASLHQDGLAAWSALQDVRERGYAIESGISAEGVCAVAVPIELETGETIAALDLVGVAPTITLELLRSHVRELEAAAARVAPAIAALAWTRWRPYASRARR